ncbi:hypothetical protein L210DRAFT_3649252 [Boletus edulis BED1]|uniref:Uncharacterized protein n=1 Tax=Boletus edulis BED1 TaxID=1328754 RepID=A0AAD4BM81_BOLED|nr:hypothetical protein L210DRAFT_3649252 [Boletus edulis BED1]
MFSRPSSPFLQKVWPMSGKEKSARPIVPATSHSSTPILMLPFSFSSRSVVNWFSEKLEFRVRERPSAAPIQDPIEPVLTLRANMRGVDGLSPSVGDSGCHAFNRIGSSETEGIKTLGREHVGSAISSLSFYPSLPMSTSTTEIANAVMICKKGHVCCPMATSRPFVVCSLFTKRYAPSRRVSVQKWPVSPKQQLSSRNGSLPSVVPKAEPRPRLGCTACSRTKPLADVDPGRLTRDQRPAPQMPTTYLQAVSPSLSAPPSPDLSSFPSQSWTIVANVDIEQISTPVTICGDEDLSGMDYAQRSGVPTMPTDSCGPPTLGSSSPTQLPSLTVAEASDEDLSGTNVDIEQISTPVTICGDKDLSGMDYAQRSGVPTTPTDSCGPPTLGSSSPTQLPSLTVAEASDEDLSGTNVDIEQISTPVMICGDEDLSGMDYAQRSGVPTTPTDSCGPPTLGSSSHPQSSSLTVVEPSPGSANATAESDDASGMGIQTKGSSNDTSQTDLSTVTPARNAAASTVPAKVTDNDPATSTTLAAGTIMRCKFGYVPRRPMASSRPFRIRVQKLRLTPSATSRKKQALVPRTVSFDEAGVPAQSHVECLSEGGAAPPLVGTRDA